MNRNRSPHRQQIDMPPPTRRRIAAELATIAATVTVAAIGPGLALAEAKLTHNHNEVMATARR
ncbi:hypothetical protein [Rhodococcus daqingensis]|uniref:Uncharacterized protein n=1 Tax=Rhodococcus daqingensis TaxID=2479363 RepID=A0ABW2RUM7_9NOCA